MDSMDDLLRETEHLARHMSSYQHDIPPDLTSTMQISEASKKQLLQMHDELWQQFKQCHSQIMALDAETLPESGPQSKVQLYLLMMQVKALTVEYEQWLKREPRVISRKEDILLVVGKEELQNVDRDLETMLSISRAEARKLKSDLEKEQQWLSEQQQFLEGLRTKLKDLENLYANISEKSAARELKRKLRKESAYREELLAAFEHFLEEHFPLPEEHDKRVKKKGPTEEPSVQLVPMNDILETLINKLMETPHDPYVVIQPEYWPPYIEMLLRFGIALRHPADANRIRLEAFHQ
ncbi:centromere protein K [Pseudophryne corroboree]|uniref:centromere protein K n=1 Tax=Pseudophryne corroboree TaxID=495146 RepID=UPI003081B808